MKFMLDVHVCPPAVLKIMPENNYLPILNLTRKQQYAVKNCIFHSLNIYETTIACKTQCHHSIIIVTTAFVDRRLWKPKHPRKRFQNFRQSYVLSTNRIEIHQSQPANMTQGRSEGHASGCDWWISIRSINNT